MRLWCGPGTLASEALPMRLWCHPRTPVSEALPMGLWCCSGTPVSEALPMRPWYHPGTPMRRGASAKRWETPGNGDMMPTHGNGDSDGQGPATETVDSVNNQILEKRVKWPFMSRRQLRPINKKQQETESN